MKITVQTIVNAPVEVVWRAYTTPADIMEWNAASDDWHTPSASVDLRVGGDFTSRMEARDGSMGFDFAGTYTVVEENARLKYEFGDRTAEIVFTPVENSTEVTVTFDAETENPADMQRDGWQAILSSFARYAGALGR